jgi:hypothetical protein
MALLAEAGEKGPTILVFGLSLTILAAQSLTRLGGIALFGGLGV